MRRPEPAAGPARATAGRARRGARALAALALALTLASSCSGGPGSARVYPPGPFSGGPPRRGGSAVLLREGDQDYLDPALSYEAYSAPVIAAVFHTLLDYVDRPGSAGAALEPALAERLPELREGGTLYCFRIRSDARFGPPLHRHLTAADFKYAFERMFRVGSPGITFYRHVVGASDVLAGRTHEIAGVIARGDSLYLRLTRPDPVFLYLLSMSFTAPLPREVVERYEGSFSRHTVATGPYRVAEYAPRRRILLVRNPDHAGPPAYLDTIEVRFGVSAVNATMMVQRGLADGGFFDVPADAFVRMKRDSAWRGQLELADGLSTRYLFFNVRRKPFDDVRVRQAVAWALDRRAFVKTWSGRAVAAGEFLPLGMPGAVALNRYEPRDVPRARRLLAAAGYPDGFTTVLHGWTDEPAPRELTLIQQQLAEAGIRTQLELTEGGGYWPMVNDTSNRIPFGYYGWVADYVDPSNFFDTLLNGHRITPIHNNNVSMFDDPSVNQRIERAMVTSDDSVRGQMWRELDVAVMDRVPVAPTVHPLESRVYSPRLGGWYRHVTRILKLEGLYLKRPLAPGGATARREVRS